MVWSLFLGGRWSFIHQHQKRKPPPKSSRRPSERFGIYVFKVGKIWIIWKYHEIHSWDFNMDMKINCVPDFISEFLFQLSSIFCYFLYKMLNVHFHISKTGSHQRDQNQPGKYCLQPWKLTWNPNITQLKSGTSSSKPSVSGDMSVSSHRS